MLKYQLERMRKKANKETVSEEMIITNRKKASFQEKDWRNVIITYEYNMIVDIIMEVRSNCAILELSRVY